MKLRPSEFERAPLFESLSDFDYIEATMTISQIAEIIPAQFPELSKLVWNRDPLRPMADNEVFELYARNWRFVDQEHLTDEETELLRTLENKYGRGFGPA